MDIQARPTQITNIDGQTMSIQYGLGDLFGGHGDFIRSVTRFDGSTVAHGYDHVGRRISTVFTDGQAQRSITTTHTPHSLVGSVSDGSVMLGYSYDGALRTTGISQSGQGILPVTAGYVFDPVGNLIGTAVQIGQGLGLITLDRAYSYDAINRITELQAESGTFSFAYETDNGLVGAVTLDTGIGVRYEYDVMDRQTRIEWHDAALGVDGVDMSWNSADMITRIDRDDGTYRVYAYDSLDRLTAEQHFDATDTLLYSASYSYDLAGNRTQTVINNVTHTYTLGIGDRLASWGVNGENTLSYGNAGNVTQRVVSGQPTLAFAWDLEYRLTGITSGGNPVESYQYDPTGRRIKTTAGNSTTWHVYDGAHVIADVDDQGELIRSYTWGPGIDNLLALTVHNGQTSESFYAMTDHVGTVWALVDEDGAVVESYRYDAWGNVLSVHDGAGQPLTESAFGNRYLFQGREYSWAVHAAQGGAGLYNFRARWYDPRVGRWLSNDPIGISGGLNQYAAFGNNPVVFVDPEGERVISVDTGQRRIVNNTPQVQMVNRTVSRWHGPGHPGRQLTGTTRWEDATGIFLTGFFRDDDGCWQLRSSGDALAAARAYAAAGFAQGAQSLEYMQLGYLGAMGGIALIGSTPPALVNLAIQNQFNVVGAIRGATLGGPVGTAGKVGLIEGAIRTGRYLYYRIRDR